MLEEPFSILPLASICDDIVADVTQLLRIDEDCYQYAFSLHKPDRQETWQDWTPPCEGPFAACEVSQVHEELLELQHKNE